MCGIVGAVANRSVSDILLEGLSRLEYRGYDSAGIAVRDENAEVEIVKAKGKLKVLKEMTNDGKAVKGTCGIGHTRWATHGEPSALNAHPHCSDDENVIAVHNGIIENITQEQYFEKIFSDVKVPFLSSTGYFYPQNYPPLLLEA